MRIIRYYAVNADGVIIYTDCHESRCKAFCKEYNARTGETLTILYKWFSV